MEFGRAFAMLGHTFLDREEVAKGWFAAQHTAVILSARLIIELPMHGGNSGIACIALHGVAFMDGRGAASPVQNLDRL